MKCSQCEKPAFYQLENGILLCLDCYSKLVQIQNILNTNYERQINALYREAEMTTGISIGLPYPERINTNIQTGPVGINHGVIVNDSQVGTINTGVIRNINSNIEQLLQNENGDIAIEVKNFITGTINSKDITEEQQDQIIKLVNQILSEKNSKKPNKELIQSLIGLVGTLISNSDSLVKIWEKLKSFF